MTQSKKNLLFIIVDLALVAIIGLILGFCLPIGKENALLLSYILLLVTLLAPIAMYFTIKNLSSPIGISTLLFVVGNIITLVVFMFKVREIKVVAITEAAIIGAYLVAALICLVAAPTKKE